MKRLMSVFMMMLSISVTAQHSDNLSLLARWASGPCRAIVATSDAVFMGNGSYLDVLDATNYSTRYARYEFQGPIQDIYYRSFKLYVAVQNHGVFVLSNITNPTLTASWINQGDIRRLTMTPESTDYIYVANGASGLSIIRTSDYVQVGSVSFSAPVYDVYAAGSNAYLAVGSLGLVTVNIANPAAPVVLDTLDTPGSAYGVQVRGTQAFVADRTEGVWVVNVTTPANLSIAKQWEAEPAIQLSDIIVDVGAEKAYLSDEGYGLRVLDLGTMTQSTSLSTSGDALYLYMDQSFVYLADGNTGMKKIDVAVVPPQQKSNVLSGGAAMDVLYTSDYTYVAGGESGVWILDNAGLHDGQVSVLHQIGTHNALKLAKVENVLIIADGTAGLLFYNVANPAEPGYITSFVTLQEMLDITVSGDSAYAAEGTAGIRIFDISNPVSPVNRGSMEGISGFKAVGVDADARSGRLYVSADTDGLKIINLTNRTLSGSYSNSSHTQNVGIPGPGAEVVFLADGPNGLVGLNVSNPAEITQTGTVNTEGYAYDMDFRDGTAVLADGQGTVRLYDITDPDEPVSVGYYHTSGTSYGVDAVDDTLVVADGEGGVYFLTGNFTSELVFERDSLHFGNVVLNKSRSLWLTLINRGSSAVYVTELSSESGRFTASSGLPRWIAAGDTSDGLLVTFTPNTVSTLHDTLIIDSDATNSPHRMPVVGSGIESVQLTEYEPDFHTFALYHMNALTGSLMPDESSYGYLDGTVTGVTVTQTDGGNFGQGLVFDNENDIININLEQMDLLPMTDNWDGFSIETWFKLSTIPEGTAVLYQMMEGEQVLFELSIRDNKLMGRTSQGAGNPDTLLSDETALQTGVWYHGALTYAGNMKLYLNGALAAQKETHVSAPDGIITARIGNNASLTQPFNGVLDEMRLSSVERQPWEFNVSTGRIRVPVQQIVFGNVYVNQSKYYYLTVSNTGAGILYVDSLFTQTPNFTVSIREFSLGSNGSRTFWLGFTPSVAGTDRDTLNIVSQDLFQPLLRIPLSGYGFQAVNLAAYTPDAYTSGLWHLDGNAEMDSISDGSGNGLTGYFQGAGIEWDYDWYKYGTSLQFSGGTSWVRVPYNAQFDYSSTPFSLETWFSLSDSPNGKNYYTLFRRGTGSTLQYEILYGDTVVAGKGLVVKVYGPSGQAYTLYGWNNSQMDLSKWYHMALTWDRNKLRLYMNGIAVDSLIYTGTLRVSNADLAIGGDYGEGNGFFGYLDEIRFSNIDRQPEEFNVGIPNLFTSTTEIDFGTVLVDDSESRIFELSNIGSLPLGITRLYTGEPVFEVSPPSDTLTAGETLNVMVRFVPQITRQIRDTLRIVSNDPDDPVHIVVLLGNGIDYRPKEPYTADNYTVALYHCDDNLSAVADSSGNNHHGTLSASTGDQVNRIDPAYFDGGFELNGDFQYLYIPDHPALRFDMASQSCTIECFFKTDTVDQVLFFKDPYSGSNTRGNYGLTIDTNGRLLLHGFSGGETYVADGVWHHVAFVYDHTVHQATLYLDGNIELQDTWQAGDTDILSTGSLNFGARWTTESTVSWFSQCAFDEIRISSIARRPWELIFKRTGIYMADDNIEPQKGVAQVVNIHVPAGENKTVTLYYRQAGQRTYQYVAATPVTGTDNLQYQATVPAAAITEKGLEGYVQMTQGGKTYTDPLYDPFNHPYAARVRFTSLPADSTLPKKKYTMISVPADLDDANAGTVLLDDMTAWDPHKWRCLTWKDTTYRELDDSLSYSDSLVFSFNQGRAFWIISDQQKNWDVNAGYSVSSEEPYRFNVRPQWSMIGSPFAFPVDWNDCALSSDSLGTLYYYDGKGYRLDWPVFEPWAGYWIFNAGRTYFDLYVPPREKSGLSKGSAPRGAVLEAMDKTDWIWQLSAKSESAADLDNFFGVRRDASAEWDLRDRAEPPPMGDYISVFFDHSDWKKNPGTYAADIRTIENEGTIWDITVESRLEKSLIKLNWTLHQSMPEGWKSVLVDEQEGLCMDMTTQAEYAYVTPSGSPNVRTLKCLAGPAEFVDEQLKNGIAPVEFHLFQNYPNPFNPSTQIAYTIPKKGHVRLGVYNMLGQRISQLVNGEQAAGAHQIEWSGITDSGTAVSSGVYFYKLEYPGRVSIRKMILVR